MTYPCVFCDTEADNFLSYGGCSCRNHVKFPLCPKCELMLTYMARGHLGLDARFWRMFTYEEVMAQWPDGDGEVLTEGAEEAALAEVERLLRGEE